MAKSVVKNYRYHVDDTVRMISSGHCYVCEELSTGEVLCCDKLPPILKILRKNTGYTYQIPHGNKVRTMILEQGSCDIDAGIYQYRITVDRW